MNNYALFRTGHIFTTFGRAAYLLGGKGYCERRSPRHLGHLAFSLLLTAGLVSVRGGRWQRPVAVDNWSVR